MNRIRLLPIVLFATTALLLLKLVGLSTGSGSFAVGPGSALAAEEDEASVDEMLSMPRDPVMEAPIDLAREAAAMAAEGQTAEAPPAAAPTAGDPAAPEAACDPVTNPCPEVTRPEDMPAPTVDGVAPGTDAAGAAPQAPETAPAQAEGEGSTPQPVAETPAAAPPPPQLDAAGNPIPPRDDVSAVRPPEYAPPENPTERSLLESLADRRKALEEREREMDMRMKLLQAAEERLQKRVDELKSIEAQLGDTAAGDGSEGGASKEDEQLKALVTLYENMKPAAAAAVFEKLDGYTLVALSRQMNPRKLSPIMSLMSPEKAGKLTVALAGSQGPREVVVRVEDVQGGPSSTQSLSPTELPKILPLNP